MYIPTQFYGKLNACVSASGGQETGEFISGSTVWRYHKYTTLGSGSFTIHTGSASDARVFLVGGGGGGGYTESNGDPFNESAGGGGAGGVVYTDYRLGPGTYTLYVGDGGDAKGNEGENSWIEMNYLPSDYSYYAPTGSRLTAEGGGYGGYFLNINNTSTGKVNASAGGSGGGGCASLRFTPAGYTIASSNGGRVPQGFGGGNAAGFLCQNNSETTAVGGGGAGAKSDDTNCVNSSGYQTPGGIGKSFNVDGTSTLYAVGGPSMRVGQWELAPGDTDASRSSRPLGSGGFARSASYSKIPSLTKGREGIIVILYPICNLELLECTTYTFDGNATGGTITYIPCGSSSLETATINFDQTGSFCTYPIPGDYPSTTGTVTISAVGNCSENYPIPVVPTCTTGSVTNAYIYDIQIPIACYPSPESCQSYFEASSIVTYTTYDGNAVTQSLGGWFGNGQHQICAREYPAPTLQCGAVGGSTTPCSITKTSNICGYYCSGSI